MEEKAKSPTPIADYLRQLSKTEHYSRAYSKFLDDLYQKCEEYAVKGLYHCDFALPKCDDINVDSKDFEAWFVTRLAWFCNENNLRLWVHKTVADMVENKSPALHIPPARTIPSSITVEWNVEPFRW